MHSVATVATVDSVDFVKRRSTMYRAELVDKFLKDRAVVANGFDDVNGTKRILLSWFTCQSERIRPIHLVAMHGDYQQMLRAGTMVDELVELVLLSAGADTRARTSLGRTALSIAEDCNEDDSHLDIIHLLATLQEQSKDAEEELGESAETESEDETPAKKPTNQTSTGNLEMLLKDPVLKVDM
eukprot:Skav204706  [mRNA]  locus=scaffold3332:36326:42599:- [translate_table: standard]